MTGGEQSTPKFWGQNTLKLNCHQHLMPYQQRKFSALLLSSTNIFIVHHRTEVLVKNVLSCFLVFDTPEVGKVKFSIDPIQNLFINNKSTSRQEVYPKGAQWWPSSQKLGYVSILTTCIIVNTVKTFIREISGASPQLTAVKILIELEM